MPMALDSKWTPPMYVGWWEAAKFWKGMDWHITCNAYTRARLSPLFDVSLVEKNDISLYMQSCPGGVMCDAVRAVQSRRDQS